MLYQEIFRQLESARWNMTHDIRWEKFDKSKLTERQLTGIRMNAILEWSAMPTAEMFLRDNADDVDFSAFISIWFFEEQKHSLVLLEYLRRFAPDYLPSEKELAAVRFTFDTAPPLESLALHFCGEVRLNQWYRCAHEWHTEPVIRQIYTFLSNDEARHARAYFEYMKKAVSLKQHEATLAFSKIGVLMTNARLNKAMHPTNLHVNKSLFPNDTVNGKLPDPGWLEHWLNHEILFDEPWENKVNRAVLNSFSHLFQVKFESTQALREYRKNVFEQ
ncbi:MAG TPA: ferritin [Gammaproteobacteria bacterium]|nr:ferritin [Gammaproteobacteria bacterium]